MNKEESKKYEIKSFEQLCNIATDENIQNLATDTALWLLSYQQLISKVRQSNTEYCEGKSNWEIAQGGFDWIDDGINDITGFKTVVNETGETRFYKFPNK